MIDRKKERKKKPQGKNIMVFPITQGGHNKTKEYKGHLRRCKVHKN